MNNRSESEFQALANAIPQIVWTASADGALDWYSQGWYDYTGQTPAEAAGWGWQAVHHPEDLPEVMRRWPDSITTGEPFEMEFRLRGADGAFRWFLTRVRPYRDENGRLIRWFGTNTDIDDQKHGAEQTERMARILQDVLLPEHLPSHPQLTFDATYVAAGSKALLGGDWYDAFSIPDGRIAVSIGDVAGHGLNAAVIAGRLRNLIFAEALDGNDPAATLNKADRVLRAQSETIATAFVGYIDPDTGAFSYASAGHPAPIIAGAGLPASLLPQQGAPLGVGFVTGALNGETQTTTISVDAIVVLYTDGVTEVAREPVQGEQRLLEAVDQIAAGKLPFSAAALYAATVNCDITSDDIALLLIRRSPPGISAITPLEKTWRFHSSHAHSAHVSRRELITFLAAHAAPDADLYVSELILGELLANCVEHAPGLVEVLINWSGIKPHVLMRDSGPGLDAFHVSLPTDDFDENGRGLFLIQSLSERFTIQRLARFGTEISLVLPIERFVH